ncbi:MAG TPA: nucleotide sugar dehydrogenase [Bacteroidetes bacterium]|nr:nucleotide sugar dehydrogenase [Bacteroidota bacterium]
MIQDYLRRIDERDYTVGIIGLGYVGLPLMWTFHKKDMPVLGFDIDTHKVKCVNEGKSYIKHLGDEMMSALAKSDICEATTDFSRIPEADALLLCVPTPLDQHREPDMSYVVNTTEAISKYLRKGHLVVLESTTYPGTTEDVMIPILEKTSGLKAGVDFFVAYSPEREDPGNVNFNTERIPKVVGGSGEDALTLAKAMYDVAIVQTVPVSDCKTAEAVKLTENIFRSVNIALVNELKMVFAAMDIDVHEVLDAAATKPFGFMKFSPGPGLGGHCIPIDPFYLTWKAREFGVHTKFIELAGEVNTAMPDYVVNKTVAGLNKFKKSVNGSRILLAGLAYKPDVDDMRESPTFILMELLEKMGATVEFFDPHISFIHPTREHEKYNGKKSVEWSKEVIQSFDAVIVVTDHKAVNYDDLYDWSGLIIDSRNVYKGRNGKVLKA